MSWSWKVEDRDQNPDLNLRYEPGNWGDVIKGVWALTVARGLVDLGRRPLRILDPFAGAPSYPLVAGAAQRIESLEGPFRQAVEPFRARDRYPSTASLVLSALAAEGVETQAQVFDLDEARRDRWAEQPGVEVLDVASGDDALQTSAALDLVIVDPYDLFERWEVLLPRALSSNSAVLLYLFNKAPRGVSAHRRYQDLRTRLDQLRGDRLLVVGRIPSDAVLPRAFHEMLLVAGGELIDASAETLRQATQELGRRLADEGCFEGP